MVCCRKVREVLIVSSQMSVPNIESFVGRISNRLIKLFEYERAKKIINIDDLYRAQEKSEEDLKSIRTLDQLDPGQNPFHAVYVSAHNLISVIAEKLSGLKELAEFSKVVANAEETYMPGYPPMSPVTNSIFSFWSLFDLRLGISKETIGTCVLDLTEVLRINDGLAELIQNLQSSRLGVYVHRGVDERGNVLLYEIFTHRLYKCHSSSTYQGNEGELWLVRLAVPPFSLSDQYIAMTTPYVLLNSNQSDWENYFEHLLPRLGISPPLMAYEELMKYGLIPDYWNEYIFQAYANHIDTAIFLVGTPDKPHTLPHFDPDSAHVLIYRRFEHRTRKGKHGRRRQKN